MNTDIAWTLLIASSLLASPSLPSATNSGPIVLWPSGAPGSESKTVQEAVRVTPAGDHVVSSVHRPSIIPYIPAAEQSKGAAVIVIPGGGHRELWMDHEGYNVAQWLSNRGIAAFVLKYRLARETNSTYIVDDHALADTQRAIRLVRSRAPEWRVNPAAVGVLGFSAGGELAALSSMRFDSGNPSASDLVDRQSSRPDFQALIYPGRSSRIEPATNSPPAFLACGYNDRPDISEGLAQVYLKFRQAKVSAELHIWSGSGHGFGFRPTNSTPAGEWIVRFEDWLRASGSLKKL